MYTFTKSLLNKDSVKLVVEKDDVYMEMHIENRYCLVDVAKKLSPSAKTLDIFIEVLEYIKKDVDRVGGSACPERVAGQALIAYMKKYNLKSPRDVQGHQKSNLVKYYMSFGAELDAGNDHTFSIKIDDLIRNVKARTRQYKYTKKGGEKKNEKVFPLPFLHSS
jgi:hypothetical protein